MGEPALPARESLESREGREGQKSPGGHDSNEQRGDAGVEGIPPVVSASAIVLATGTPMPWTPLLGRPLLAWAVDAFERAAPVDDIVLVVAADRLADARRLASREGWRKVRGSPAPARAGSGLRAIHAGLETLETLDALVAHSREGGLVVIHEAIRPLVTPELIAAAIAATAHSGRRDRVIVGAEPVKETIKRVQGGLVRATLPRERLVDVQTPAVFSRARLRSLLDAVPGEADLLGDLGELATALAGRALGAGISVATYPASPENVMVTSAEELAVAEALLRPRNSAGGEPRAPA